jgi:hypothetical protein
MNQPLMVVDWDQVILPERVEVVTDERGASVLRVPASPRRERIQLAVLAPEITSEAWAVIGRIRYEDVQGRGYLEMWSVFPDGARYFSRTMSESGPLAALSGTSPWRDLVLPFYSSPEAADPSRLELSLVVGEHGPIELGPLKVVEMSADTPIGDLLTDGWWGSRTSGWMGGVGGAIVGLFGAFIGWASSRGNRLGLALVSAWALAGVGVALLCAAVVAVVLSQPVSVWLVPCVLGVVAAVAAVSALPTIRRRRADAEDRLLRAQEISGR